MFERRKEKVYTEKGGEMNPERVVVLEMIFTTDLHAVERCHSDVEEYPIEDREGQ